MPLCSSWLVDRDLWLRAYRGLFDESNAQSREGHRYLVGQELVVLAPILGEKIQQAWPYAWQRGQVVCSLRYQC
jgi:hypothetical protein